MARQTIRVTDLRERANRMLATPDSTLTVDDSKAMRTGVIGLVESFLFETGNYRGFVYLSTELKPEGGLKDDYDDTRRRYLG